MELDESTGRPTRLLVCGGWFGRRRHVFGAEDVLAVFPAERRLIVSPRTGGREPA